MNSRHQQILQADEEGHNAILDGIHAEIEAEQNSGKIQAKVTLRRKGRLACRVDTEVDVNMAVISRDGNHRRNVCDELKVIRLKLLSPIDFLVRNLNLE